MANNETNRWAGILSQDTPSYPDWTDVNNGGEKSVRYAFSKETLPEPMYGIYTNEVSEVPDYFSDFANQEKLAEALKKANQVKVAQMGASPDKAGAIADKIFQEDVSNEAYPQNGFIESAYWGWPRQLANRERKLKLEDEWLRREQAKADQARRVAQRKMVYEAIKDKVADEAELNEILSRFE